MRGHRRALARESTCFGIRRAGVRTHVVDASQEGRESRHDHDHRIAARFPAATFAEIALVSICSRNGQCTRFSAPVARVWAILRSLGDDDRTMSDLGSRSVCAPSYA